jgi:hypothetical protein
VITHDTSTATVASTPPVKQNSNCKGKNCYCKQARGRGLSRISWIV